MQESGNLGANQQNRLFYRSKTLKPLEIQLIDQSGEQVPNYNKNRQSGQGSQGH